MSIVRVSAAAAVTAIIARYTGRIAAFFMFTFVALMIPHISIRLKSVAKHAAPATSFLL